nr:zf-TFIIB domain-containing protein [Aquisediminimonas sediminicola]
MACPTCQIPLVMSERQGVEIDYCPQCRGVWLDRGELDKIIERSAKDAAPAAPAAPAFTPQQRPADYRPADYGHSDYGHRPPKRRKSFLEELFD